MTPSEKLTLIEMQQEIYNMKREIKKLKDNQKLHLRLISTLTGVSHDIGNAH